MMHTSEGLVVRTLKYGETSVIMDIFSPDSGIRSYIIGGVRKRNARTQASITSVLNFVRFVYYEKQGDGLQRIKEMHLEYVYGTLPFDIVKSSVALFLTEMVKRSVQASDTNEEIYRFVKQRFVALDRMSATPPNFHIIFLLELSSLLGIGIQNNHAPNRPHFNLKEGAFSHFTGDMKYLMIERSSKLLADFLTGPEPKIGRTERIDLLKGLVDFFRYHIEGFGNLRSLDVLLSLYE